MTLSKLGQNSIFDNTILYPDYFMRKIILLFNYALLLSLLHSCSFNHIADLNGNQPELLEKKNDLRVTGGINANVTYKNRIGGELNLSYALSPHWFVTSGFKTGGYIFLTGYGYGTLFRSGTLGGGYYSMNAKGNYHQLGLRFVRGDEIEYEVDGTNYNWQQWRDAFLYNGVDFSYASSFATPTGRWGYCLRFSELYTYQHIALSRLGIFANYMPPHRNKLALSFTTGFTTQLNHHSVFPLSSVLFFRPTLHYFFNAKRKK
jgi:hypothetical protein